MATLILGGTGTSLITLDGTNPFQVELFPAHELRLSSNRARAEHLRQQARELAAEAERAARVAHRWDVFLAFYDAFFGALSPFYNLTLAAMQHQGLIQAAQVDALRCPDDDFEEWARRVGLVAGIGVGFFAGSATTQAGRATVIGSRSFWFTPSRTIPVSQWIHAIPSHGIWGTLNACFRLGPLNIQWTFSQAAAFGMVKGLLNWVADAIRSGER